MRRLFYLTAIALLTFNSLTHSENVEILQDSRGVPHIFASSDSGALYGLGWMHARDRAFQMHFNLRVIQGRSAEVLGDRPKKKPGDTTITHDRKMRLLGYYRAATRLVPNLDEETRALLQAYCNGVNDYMEQNPDERLYLFETYSLTPEPWTPADCIAVWWNMGKFFSGEGLHDTMTYHRLTDERTGSQGGNARGRGNPHMQELMKRARNFVPPKDDEAAVVQREDVSTEWLNAVEAFLQDKTTSVPLPDEGEIDPKFSHAWVVGGEKTTTGSSVLVSDPQTPVRNPSLFYEAYYSGVSFTVRGIGVPGSPVILIGFTDRVAWGLTALGADQADQFFIEVHPEDDTRYRYDNEWLDMTIVEETILVKNGDPIPLQIRETRFGPIITSIAHATREGDAVALKRIPQCETDRETIQGFLDMIRAPDATSFSKALEGWRFPSANIVFGDREGTIGFWTMAAIPIRSPHALQGGRATHPGTHPAYEWQGIMPYRFLPHVINPERGHIHSANHRPIGSFYPGLLGISTGSAGETDRSWRLAQRLSEKHIFSTTDVLDIHYDTVSATKTGLLRLAYILHEQDYPYDSETHAALLYLAPWMEAGGQSDLRIPGTELVNEINTMFRLMNSELAFDYGGGLSGLCLFLKDTLRQAEAGDELDPRVGDYLNDIIRQAWLSAERKYGSESSRWNERAREAIDERPMPYFESLDGFYGLDDSNDMTFPELYCIDGGTLLSQAAQSYTQFVPMHNPDEARSILPVGQSEHPDSPWRLSTMEAWQHGTLYPAPISREAIEEIAETRQVLNYED